MKLLLSISLVLASLLAGQIHVSAWESPTIGKILSLAEFRIGLDTAPDPTIQITADKDSVPLGKSVIVTALAKRGGQPASGEELWAYVNGKQWGAQEITDSNGAATFILPLPYPQKTTIQVIPKPKDFHWPTSATVFGQSSDFLVGTPLPTSSPSSNLLTVSVTDRKFSPTVDPAHLVGTPWYPWFTRFNAHINGGHGGSVGVPLLGSYASTNPDVIRQQMLWMDEVGINFIQVDWSNNLSYANHWKDHLPGVEEMVTSTRALFDTLAQMRSEGLPTPQVTMLFGIAPPFSLTALNEEMQFFRDSFVNNPKYAGLFVIYLGKPLATILSVLPDSALQKQVVTESSDFTIRWVWGDSPIRPGWWVWGGSQMPPVMTHFNGTDESLTVSTGVPEGTGWKDPKALGKRGGSTWLQGFQVALKSPPSFLFLHQFNEWGESYSTELGNDFEPSALGSLGMGSTGKEGGAGPGWGFYYLNLARAFVQIYHGEAPESTILTVGNPLRNMHVSQASLNVTWMTIGKEVSSYDVLLDGATKDMGVTGNSSTVSLSGVAPGKHVITVRANGAVTRFPLSITEDDEPLTKPQPCSVSVPFELNN